MSANRYISDGSGTTRHIRKRFVADSSGITRQIKKRYVADAGGVGRLTYASADFLTLVAGSQISGSAFNYGYLDTRFPSPYGSLSPAVLGDGKTVILLGDASPSGAAPFTRTMSIAGFSSNPGIGYLTALTLNGVTLSGSVASYSFAFSSRLGQNVGSWTWSITGPQLIAPGSGYQVMVQRA
jgi:hypothetical protein